MNGRLEEVMKMPLATGSHTSIEDGACVMEMVAYVANEPWSDSPECVSPVIGAFLRRWNDDLDDEGRQMLKPLIPKLVGTKASKKVEERRGWMAADWLVRVHTPAWLELAGVTESAAALRALPPLTSAVKARKAQPTIDAARKDSYAARDAAWTAARAAAWTAARAAAWAAARAAAWAAAWAAAGAAAGDAARAAARDAAWDAAWAAAGDAAWDAAWTAAGTAAWDAAWAAAGDAAWTAARAAAWTALAPTKTALQKSALELVEAMIEA